MKLNADFKLSLETAAVRKLVEGATRNGLRDTVVAITHDTVEGSPWLTGNNRRSIAGEVSGMGVVAGEGGQERMVDDSKVEGAIYSTSGYGGNLELDHPTKSGYFRRSLDMHWSELIPNIRRYVER